MARQIKGTTGATYTVEFTLSFLSGRCRGIRDNVGTSYSYETKTLKTLKGAVEAMIKTRLEEKFGDYYGNNRTLERATVKDASGEILISYELKTVRDDDCRNSEAFSNKWGKIVPELKVAASVQVEVEAIADKWAAKNSDTVKAYFARDLYIERFQLKRAFEEVQRERAAELTMMIDDDGSNDEPDEDEDFSVTPADDSDDDDDDGKIDNLATTKETTALVAITGTEKETRYEVEYFTYKEGDAFPYFHYGTCDYTSELGAAIKLALRDYELRGTVTDKHGAHRRNKQFGGATVTRFVNGGAYVVMDLKYNGSIETFDDEAAQILDAIKNGTLEEPAQPEQPAIASVTETSTETALAIYVPHLETVEVKTAVEIAEDEYRRMRDEANKAHKICARILDKCGEYNGQIDDLQKKLKKIEGSYKRSKLGSTKERLYNDMIAICEQIDRLQPTADSLNKMYNAFFYEYVKLSDRELKARREMVTARNDAGLKYSVMTYVKNSNTRNSVTVRTIAEAVAFIYQNISNATGFADWTIFTESVEGLTTRRNTVVQGYNLYNDGEEVYKEIFTNLIQNRDAREEFVEAEIAQPSEKATVHYDKPADEFNAIAFRAMHYFTLDDFVTPISELHEFIERTGYAAAQDELNEWIEMATNAGIEITADTQTAAPEADTATAVQLAPAAEFEAGRVYLSTSPKSERHAYNGGSMLVIARNATTITVCYTVSPVFTTAELKIRHDDSGEYCVTRFDTLDDRRDSAKYEIRAENIRSLSPCLERLAETATFCATYGINYFEIDEIAQSYFEAASIQAVAEDPLASVDVTEYAVTPKAFAEAVVAESTTSILLVAYTTFKIGEIYTGYDEYYGRREFKVTSREDDYISFEVIGEHVQSYLSNRTASAFAGTAQIVHLEEYGDFEAVAVTFWDACNEVANFTIAAIDVSKPAAATAIVEDTPAAQTTETTTKAFCHDIRRWEKTRYVVRFVHTSPIIYDRGKFP